MEHSPILISVYSRLDHLRRCVNSLKSNPQSKYTDLYIVSDAAYREADIERVSRVRNYIGEITGFRSVTAINRERNLGSFVSVKQAIDDLFRSYDRLIFLEDDNEVSVNFLKFLNDCLSFYEKDPSIISVSGYGYPVCVPKSYPYDIYRWKGFTAWGVGLWKDRWHSIVWSLNDFAEIMKSPQKRRELNNIADHLYPEMVKRFQKNTPIIDVIVSWNIYKTQRYSIFPVLSKVRNTGADGQGEHGGVSNQILTQQIDDGRLFELQNIPEDKYINAVLRKHFSIPFMYRARMSISSSIPSQYKDKLKSLLLSPNKTGLI
jgi:hypothetical protein